VTPEEETHGSKSKKLVKQRTPVSNAYIYEYTGKGDDDNQVKPVEKKKTYNYHLSGNKVNHNEPEKELFNNSGTQKAFMKKSTINPQLRGNYREDFSLSNKQEPKPQRKNEEFNYRSISNTIKPFLLSEQSKAEKKSEE